MKLNKKVKIQQQTKDGTLSLCLPKHFVQMLRLNKGDQLEVILDLKDLTKLVLKKV